MMNAECPCGETATEQRLIPDGPHYGSEHCAKCGRFLRWLPKPGRPAARRPASHRHLVEKYSQGYCEMCLTSEEDLATGNELRGHHVIPYAAGGSDRRENVWILCRKCHRLVEWRRS